MPFTSAQLVSGAAYAMQAAAAGQARLEMAAVARAQERLSDPLSLSQIRLRPMRSDLHPGDCQSCGSQEFRRWQGVSVCSYCRSTAAMPAKRPRSYGLAEKYDAYAAKNNLAISQYLGLLRRSPTMHMRMSDD